MPTVKWQFDDEDLERDVAGKYEEFYDRQSGKCSLLISAVDSDDEGIYQCQIENIHGKEEAEVELEVKSSINFRPLRA